MRKLDFVNSFAAFIPLKQLLYLIAENWIEILVQNFAKFSKRFSESVIFRFDSAITEVKIDWVRIDNSAMFNLGEFIEYISVKYIQ
jgi:hypothetical protein